LREQAVLAREEIEPRTDEAVDAARHGDALPALVDVNPTGVEHPGVGEHPHRLLQEQGIAGCRSQDGVERPAGERAIRYQRRDQ
jgi:hypothetical protein